jgi:hypothetical protein
VPWINTAPEFTVLSIDLSTSMEPDVISRKCKFWLKNIIMYYAQKPVTEIPSSLIIANV